MANHQLDTTDLGTIRGGMNSDDFRRSDDVEDRRNLSLKDSLNAPTIPGAPLPPLIRRPRDLSSQAGLDDIK
jgi:hypothetical protein